MAENDGRGILQDLDTAEVHFWERAQIRPRELAALQLEKRKVEKDLGDAQQENQMLKQLMEKQETEHQCQLQAAREEIARAIGTTADQYDWSVLDRAFLGEKVMIDLRRLLLASFDFGSYAKCATGVNPPEYMEEYWERFARFEHVWDELNNTYSKEQSNGANRAPTAGK